MPRKSKTPKTPKTPKTLTKTLTNLSSIPGSPGGLGGPSNDANVTSSQTKSNVLIFAIIISLIALIINVNAIIWVYKLEAIPECKCSDNWMRTYVKYYLLIVIPVIVIMLFINIYLYSNGLGPNEISSSLYTMFRMFYGLVNFLGFINIIITIIFINRLKEMNCECSEDVRREIYFIYNIILASFIGIIILITLMSIPLVISAFRK
jgi:hypothetical protein